MVILGSSSTARGQNDQCGFDCLGSNTETSAAYDGGVLSVGVGAGDLPILAPGTGGSNLFAGCTFHVDLIGLQVVQLAGGNGAGLDFTRAELGDPDARFVWAVCPRPVFADEFSALWEVGDPLPDVIVEALVDAAIAATIVPYPVPQSAPNGSDIPLLVNLPTWLWVDDAVWQPVSATAAIPEFGISATVTATPTETEWDPGNGDTPITCEQGTPWTPGADDTDATCQLTYLESTHTTGPLVLTLTTTWDTTLACAPAGICAGANPVGDIVTTIARPIEITQVRGVLTR